MIEFYITLIKNFFIVISKKITTIIVVIIGFDRFVQRIEAGEANGIAPRQDLERDHTGRTAPSRRPAGRHRRIPRLRHRPHDRVRRHRHRYRARLPGEVAPVDCAGRGGAIGCRGRAGVGIVVTVIVVAIGVIIQELICRTSWLGGDELINVNPDFAQDIEESA